MNTRSVGSRYEEIAAEYLKGQGYEILQMNFRTKSGEIDIVARDGSYLAFVEVKYRRTSGAGYAASAVNAAKQRQISRTAALYLIKNRLPEETPCRFDVVALDGGEVKLYKNAFSYCG